MIDSFELGHLANFDKSSFATNIFYRYTDGQLDYVTIIEDGISYSQPDNLLSSTSYGVEFVGVGENQRMVFYKRRRNHLPDFSGWFEYW